MAGNKPIVYSKQIVKNFCLTCGQECEIVMVIRGKAAKERNLPTGKMWRCKSNKDHLHRTRRYTVTEVRTR